jgi:hypothetical protein
MPNAELGQDVVGPKQDVAVPDVTQTVGLVQSELKQLMEQRAMIGKRIAMIRRAITGLNAIFGETPHIQTSELADLPDLGSSGFAKGPDESAEL